MVDDSWTDAELELALYELQKRLDGNPFDARANSEYKDILNVINTRLRNFDSQQGKSV